MIELIRMKHFGFFGFGVAAFLATACGKGLNGTYVKCVQVNTTASKRATYLFPDSSNFSYQVIVYATSDCSGEPNPQPSQAGTYAQASSKVSGAQNIDFSFTSGTLDGTSLYQIYKIDGNDLILGDVSSAQNGSSSELRPNALEATPYFKQ
jgi:hypothetical protein